MTNFEPLTIKQQESIVQTLGDLIMATGIINPGPMTGPELIMFGQDATEFVKGMIGND